MIVRLLLKVGLSLGLMLGVASYGHYLTGGDPGALWQRVAGGAFDGVAGSLGGLRDTARAPAAALADVAGGDSPRESVWTWRDADGVVHYASSAPDGANARRISVDPNTNVIAPTPSPAPSASAQSAPARHATDDALVQPGIAGAVLRARGGSADGGDAARAEALLKLLQAPPSR